MYIQRHLLPLTHIFISPNHLFRHRIICFNGAFHEIPRCMINFPHTPTWNGKSPPMHAYRLFAHVHAHTHNHLFLPNNPQQAHRVCVNECITSNVHRLANSSSFATSNVGSLSTSLSAESNLLHLDI